MHLNQIKSPPESGGSRFFRNVGTNSSYKLRYTNFVHLTTSQFRHLYLVLGVSAPCKHHRQGRQNVECELKVLNALMMALTGSRSA
jgi:hypothetical protein